MAYKDPCEILTEEDDSNVGSSVPPAAPPQQEAISEDPIFPERETVAPDLQPGTNESYSKIVSVIDSSNYYPSTSYPDYGIGIRTPGELFTPFLSENLGSPFPAVREKQSREIQGHLEREKQLRESNVVSFDVPPRDVFRHMLNKVWVMRGSTIQQKSNKIENAYPFASRPSGPTYTGTSTRGNRYLVYDYSRANYRTLASELKTDYTREPFLLYIWEEEKMRQDQDAILSQYHSRLGFRFNMRGLAHNMKLTSNNLKDFWGKDDLFTNTNISVYDETGRSRRRAVQTLKSAKAEDILDLWVLGKTNSRDQNSNKVNPNERWMLSSTDLDNNKVYYEDYSFSAPGGLDIRQTYRQNTITRRGESIMNEDYPQLTDLVDIMPYATASDFLYREDRDRLRTMLSNGQINIENLPEQPYQVSEVEKINFYEFAIAQERNNQNQGGAESIRNSPVQIYNSSNILEVNDFSASALLPRYEEVTKHHVKISFDTPHRSVIASILENKNLDHHVLEIFNNETETNEMFTQFIDSKFQGATYSGDNARGFGEVINIQKVDQIQNFTTPKKVRDFFYKIQTQDEFYRDPGYFRQSNLLYPMGHPTKNINAIEFSIALNEARAEIKSHLANKNNKYQSILDGNYRHSEVIAYKIVKKSVKTGEKLQTFYIFNNNKQDNHQRLVKKIDFIDTQVVPLETYEYSIFTINAVVGLEYNYDYAGYPINEGTGERINHDTEYESDGVVRDVSGCIDDDCNPGFGESGEVLGLSPYYRIGVAITNHLALVEAPYFQKAVSVNDSPPAQPEIVFLPEVGLDNMFTILFRPQIGSEHYHKPIAILPEDFPIIEKMISESPEPSANTDGTIRYQSITNPLIYELMMLDSAPSSYSDFSESRVFKTDFTTPFIQFKVDINKSYYILARSIDRSGISNPTEILKIRMESHEDGINPIFEPFEMKQQLSPAEIKFQNIISIEPSKSQRIINFSEVGSTSEEFYNSAPNLDQVSLSNADPGLKKIWGRKFKFRLKSKSSQKAIDINVSFQEEKREETEGIYSNQEFLESSNLAPSELEYVDVSTDQQYRYSNRSPDFAEADTGDPARFNTEDFPGEGVAESFGDADFAAEDFDQNMFDIQLDESLISNPFDQVPSTFGVSFDPPGELGGNFDTGPGPLGALGGPGGGTSPYSPFNDFATNPGGFGGTPGASPVIDQFDPLVGIQTSGNQGTSTGALIVGSSGLVVDLGSAKEDIRGMLEASDSNTSSVQKSSALQQAAPRSGQPAQTQAASAPSVVQGNRNQQEQPAANVMTGLYN